MSSEAGWRAAAFTEVSILRQLFPTQNCIHWRKQILTEPKYATGRKKENHPDR